MTRRLMAEREIGERFETASRCITDTELDLFCTIAGLRLDTFLRDDAAEEMGFKGRLVPGAYGFALVFGLLGENLDGHIHVGTDKMKVLAPLYPYDRMRIEVEILDKKESSKGNRTFVTWSWAVKNQDDVVLIQGENT